MYLWLGDFPLQTLNYAGQPPFPPPQAGADLVDGSGLGHSLGDAEEHPNPKLRPGQWKKSELGRVCKHQHMPQVSSPGSEFETQNFIISSHLKVWQKQNPVVQIGRANTVFLLLETKNELQLCG